jgi:hypothetical protein
MVLKPASLIGLVVAAMLAGGPVLAFSGDPGNDGPPTRGQPVGPENPPPADYRFSGNGFNFSMSKNAGQPASSQSTKDDDAEQTQSSRSKPGPLQRIFRSIFGD